MVVQVLPPFRRQVSGAWLRRVAEVAFAQAPSQRLRWAQGRLGLSLVVADDTLVRELNRRYRGLDEVTDVLSFSPRHSGPYEGEGEAPAWEPVPFPARASLREPLGEVVISYPQAHRQALEAGHSVQRELAALLVHGVLHLLGYDHQEPEEERSMLELQQASLERVFASASSKGAERVEG